MMWVIVQGGLGAGDGSETDAIDDRVEGALERQVHRLCPSLRPDSVPRVASASARAIRTRP
jgi:hypothetical protein